MKHGIYPRERQEYKKKWKVPTYICTCVGRECLSLFLMIQDRAIPKHIIFTTTLITSNARPGTRSALSRRNRVTKQLLSY